MKSAQAARSGQDGLYEQASADFGAALGRLARSYETDADKQRDLLQEVHLALWRSFAGFEGTCSVRTWVYRVAHKTRVRNYGGYTTTAVVLAGSLWWLIRVADPMATVGALLTMAGALAIAAQLRATRSGGSIAGRAAGLGRTASLEFHRAALERQRDFHRGAQLWIRLGALAPGPLLFFAGFARAYLHVAETIGWEALAFVLLLAAAVPLNARAARGYQRQIDEVDNFQRGHS